MKTTIRTLLLVLVALVAMANPAAARDHDDIVLTFPQLDESTRFSNDWGDPRSEDRSHKGNDLLGTQGAPVVAAADGFVERMANGPRSGYYIVLRHADDWTTWYMHLDNDVPGTDNGRGGADTAFAAGLEVGDVVRAGQVIGYVGDSGNAEGSTHHTHFELHRNGRAINPYPYLMAAWERWQLELQILRGEVPFL
jgi:murein DD-endopeptidase MepM/ murein hydrolase activator NlpD